MSEANKAATKAIFGMFDGSRTLDGVEEFVGDDFVEHQDIPGVDKPGIEGYKQIVMVYRGAFPDLTLEITRMIAEGDIVMVHSRTTGTNTGPFGPMPATGNKVDFAGVDVLRFAEAKAVEHWGYFEEAKLMEQLGLMPPR